MLVEPIDLQPLLAPDVWWGLAALAVTWVCVAGACTGASLLLARGLGWLR
jgi:hypothetical protein